MGKNSQKNKSFTEKKKFLDIRFKVVYYKSQKRQEAIVMKQVFCGTGVFTYWYYLSCFYGAGSFCCEKTDPASPTR